MSSFFGMEISMNFGEKAASRKKAKELKSELKQLKKDLLSAGCEKSRVNMFVKEFWEAIELGDALQTEYEKSRKHLGSARELIPKLLDCMSESPKAEVQESLKGLVEKLDQIYHDCSIREDDLDFQSTMKSLKQMIAENEDGADILGISGIMLRSELENIKAVLDDAAGWKAPDFLALAFYFLHEEKDSIREMESEQRNSFVFSYFRERFMDEFERECEKAGLLQKIKELEQSFVYE